MGIVLDRIAAKKMGAKASLLNAENLRQFYKEDVMRRYADTMPPEGTPEWDQWFELMGVKDWYQVGVDQKQCTPERAAEAVEKERARIYGEAKKKKHSFEHVNDDDTRERQKTWGVSFGKDKDGYFCYTHRARSKSYPAVADIPKTALKFIDSTGAKVEAKKEITDEQREKILSHPRISHIGTAKNRAWKIWRGESESTGGNAAKYGHGLYTTTHRKEAEGYGAVKQMSFDDLPGKTMWFKTPGDWEIWWNDALYRTLGYKNLREFGKDYPRVDEFVRALDPSIEGVAIGDAAGAMFVKYPEMSATAAKKSSLHIFDFDGTLVDTGEFHQSHIDDPKPIKKNLDKFKRLIADDADVIIMTARNNPSLVRRTLEKFDVDMTGISVVALGTTKNEAKGDYIARNFASKYDTITLYDDRKAYLDAAEDAMADKDATFKTVKAASAWSLPASLRKLGYEVTGDLSQFESFKAPVILSNSGDGKKGSKEQCYYALISETANEVIPVARSDEHQVGYELLDHLKRKYGVKGSFVSIGVEGNTYLYQTDQALFDRIKNVLSRWHSMGGNPCWIEGNTGRESWRISSDEFIRLKSPPETRKGQLSSAGQDIVDRLEEMARLADEIHKSPERSDVKKKRFIPLAARLRRIVENHMMFMPDWTKAAVLGDDYEQAEKAVFSFDGIKNSIHQELRSAEKEGQGWTHDRMAKIFGDVKVAKKAFDGLSQIGVAAMRIAADKRFTLLGVTDEQTHCDVCGKENLKSVMVLQDNQEGGVIRCGSECGRKLLGSVIKEYEKRSRDLGKQVRDAIEKAWIDHPTIAKLRKIESDAIRAVNTDANFAMPWKDRSAAQKAKMMESQFYRDNNFEDHPERKDEVLADVRGKIMDQYHYEFDLPESEWPRWNYNYAYGTSTMPIRYVLNSGKTKTEAIMNIRASMEAEAVKQYQIVRTDGSVDYQDLSVQAASKMAKRDGIASVVAVDSFEVAAFTAPSDADKGKFAGALDKAIERGMLFYLGWLGGGVAMDYFQNQKKKAEAEIDIYSALPEILKRYQSDTLSDEQKAEIRAELNRAGWDATDAGVDFLWNEWLPNRSA